MRYGFILLAFVLTLVGCSNDQKSHFLGYIEAKFIYIAPNVAGNLVTSYVHRGTEVKKGATLFELEKQPQAAALLQAKFQLEREKKTLDNLIQGSRVTVIEGIEASLRAAEAELALAEKDYLRYKDLYETKTVSKADFDLRLSTYQTKQNLVKQLKANLAEAKLGARTYLIQAQKAQVQAGQQQVAQLQWQLDQKVVVSPYDGRVFDVFFRKGEYVPIGQPVLSLVVPQYLYAVFYVPEAALSGLKIGQNIWMQCDECKEKYSATISFISPEAEYTPPVIYSEESRSKLVYRFEARIPENLSTQLHPGQPIQVSLKP